MALQIEPAEGKVALSFIGDEDDDDWAAGDTASGACCAPGERECDCAELAIVEGVGAKVIGIKVGDTVFVWPYARRNGLKVGGETVIVDGYAIAGKVKSQKQ